MTLKLKFVPMGSQVGEVARLRSDYPLPDEPCTCDCRPCCDAGYCLMDAERERGEPEAPTVNRTPLELDYRVDHG